MQFTDTVISNIIFITSRTATCSCRIRKCAVHAYSPGVAAPQHIRHCSVARCCCCYEAS